MDPEKKKSLHSRYNPKGEAERYINSLSLNDRIRFFILIEPGLGYMTAPLRRRVPNARIIAIHAEGKTEQNTESLPFDLLKTNAPDSEWYPDMDIPLQNFLENEIDDCGATEIRILEWRPALALYGELYLNLVEEAAAFVKRSDANIRTTKGFGSRWLKNFFKNLELIREVFCPVQLSIPFLVTGAGPGLEESISLIKEESRRDSLFILAVSSSAAALKAGGLIPDMVISTDGGNWARFHLYEFWRMENNRAASNCRPPFSFSGSANYGSTLPLAAALTAALPSQSESLPILPISDGSLWQTLILKELNIPHIVLPQRGTVSASALDLAFALSKDEIYIAGMDLATRDIRSHARPYSLDCILEEKAARLNPLYSQTYRRSSMIKAGGSFDVYASWFEKEIRIFSKRLHPLGDNNPLFSSCKNNLPKKVQTVSIREKNKYFPENFKIVKLKHEDNISARAFAVLERAIKDPCLSLKLRKELSPLLSTGSRTISQAEPEDPNDLICALADISRRDRDTAGKIPRVIYRKDPGLA